MSIGKSLNWSKPCSSVAGVLAMAVSLIAINATADTYLYWRGFESGVWDTTTLNWVGLEGGNVGTTPVQYVNNNTLACFQGKGVTDVTVGSGITAHVLRPLNGANETLRGSDLSASYIHAEGGNLTILNAINNDANGIYMKGGCVTIGNGGYLTTTFRPDVSNSSGLSSTLKVLTNGTLRASFSTDAINSKYATLYFDGGKLIHKDTGSSATRTFKNSKFVLGAGGVQFREIDNATSSTMSILPGPIMTDSILPTDGGVIIGTHKGYMLLPYIVGSDYRGGLHINGSGGYVGIDYNTPLGANPDTPKDVVFFDGASNTVSSVLVPQHTTTLSANRNIRIGNGVTACLGCNDSQTLTITSTISCANPETGFLLTTNKAGTAAVVFDPGAGRTNRIGRLLVQSPLTIASGMTLLDNTVPMSSSSDERYGVNDGSVLHVRPGGSLTVSGGELKVRAGSRLVSQNGNLLITGGVVTTEGHEFLHAYKTAATTTIRNGGRLHASTIRVAGDGNKHDASKSVLNVETGGLLRVTYKLYVNGNNAGYKATANFNGGALEWANSSATKFCDDENSRTNIAFKVLAGGMVVTNDCECWFYPPIQGGVAAGTDGGLTKWGSAAFAFFNQNNTFTGPLTVMQGTVSLGQYDNPCQPTITARVAEGARLKMNTRRQTFARIEGCGRITGVESDGVALLTVTSAIAPGMGAGAIGTLTLEDGRANIEDGTVLEIDVAADGSSDCLNYSGVLDLSKLVLHVNDVEKLTDGGTYVIANLPNGCTGEFKSTNLNSNWRTRFNTTSKCIEVKFIRGLRVIVR